MLKYIIPFFLAVTTLLADDTSRFKSVIILNGTNQVGKTLIIQDSTGLIGYGTNGTATATNAINSINNINGTTNPAITITNLAGSTNIVVTTTGGTINLSVTNLTQTSTFNSYTSSIAGVNLTNINEANTFFVETNGVDATAVKGDRSKPGLTLTNAITKVSSNNTIALGVGFFPLGSNTIAIPQGVTLTGKNAKSTIITGLQGDSNGAGDVRALVRPTTNTTVANLTIRGIAGTNTFQYPYGKGALEVSPVGTNYLLNVTLEGDSDGFYSAYSSNCVFIINNCDFNNKYDCIAHYGTRDELYVFNSRLYSLTPSTTIAVGDINRGFQLNGFTNNYVLQNCFVKIKGTNNNYGLAFNTYPSNTCSADDIVFDVSGSTGTGSSQDIFSTGTGLRLGKVSRVDGGRIINNSADYVTKPNDWTGKSVREVLTGGISNVIIGATGTGYTTGDTLTLVGGNGAGTITVNNESGGIMDEIVVLAMGNTYSNGTYSVTGGTGSGALITVRQVRPTATNVIVNPVGITTAKEFRPDMITCTNQMTFLGVLVGTNWSSEDHNSSITFQQVGGDGVLFTTDGKVVFDTASGAFLLTTGTTPSNIVNYSQLTNYVGTNGGGGGGGNTNGFINRMTTNMIVVSNLFGLQDSNGNYGFQFNSGVVGWFGRSNYIQGNDLTGNNEFIVGPTGTNIIDGANLSVTMSSGVGYVLTDVSGNGLLTMQPSSGSLTNGLINTNAGQQIINTGWYIETTNTQGIFASVDEVGFYSALSSMVISSNGNIIFDTVTNDKTNIFNGKINFGGETRTNWPTGGGIAEQNGIGYNTSIFATNAIPLTVARSGANSGDPIATFGTNAPTADYVSAIDNEGFFFQPANANTGLAQWDSTGKLVGGGAAAGQTPWTSDIEGAGHNLTNVADIHAITLDVSSTTTINELQVTSHVVPDGGGLKHARTDTGSVPSLDSVVVTVTWGTPFANTDYTVTVSVQQDDDTTTTLKVDHIVEINASFINVRVSNSNATTAKTGVLHAIAMHD